MARYTVDALGAVIFQRLDVPVRLRFQRLLYRFGVEYFCYYLPLPPPSHLLILLIRREVHNLVLAVFALVIHTVICAFVADDGLHCVNEGSDNLLQILQLGMHVLNVFVSFAEIRLPLVDFGPLPKTASAV